MADRTLQRLALPSAVSWDPETRQVVVIGSTDNPQADGFALVHTRESIRWPARPLPVFINHEAHPREFVGSVVAMELGREKGASALVCTVQLADSEAGRLAEPMVASGAARWSIRARIHSHQPGPAGSDYDRATDWEPIELSLVGAGMDTAAVTRSAAQAADPSINNALEGTMTASQTKPEAAETVTATPAELRRAAQLEGQVTRLIQAAPHAAEAIRRAAETEGLEAARGACIDAMATHQRETQPQTMHGRPGVGGDSRRSERLEDALLRRWKGDASAVTTLQLLEAVTGRRGRADELLRGAMATTDFPALFAASGFKLLRERFTEAGTGARMIARRRQSADLRDIHLLGLSEFPAMLKLSEGGEIKYANFTDRGGFYRVEEYARAVNLTRRALLSDELDAFGEALSSYGRAIAALEDDLTIAALEVGGTGAKVMEDNKALFHADHQNSTTATGLDLESLSEAAAKLREAREVGNGRKLNLAPRWLLVSAEHEVTAIQLTTEINATAASNVNPFAGGQLALMPLVDANLSGDYAYVLCDPSSPAAAIEICTGPAVADVQSQADFDTTSVKTRVLADRGLGVRDYRGIVRIPLGA
jgi:hypothetical protein